MAHHGDDVCGGSFVNHQRNFGTIFTVGKLRSGSFLFLPKPFQELSCSLLYTGLLIPGEICYEVCRLASTNSCFANSPENLLSLLQRLILMTHTTTVILPWSHLEVFSLTFLWRRGAVFIVEGGPGHSCSWGQTAWPLTEKIGKITFFLSRAFHFAIVLLLFEAFFWLSRRI